MKYSELIALQQAQANGTADANGAATTPPAAGATAAAPGATTAAVPGAAPKNALDGKPFNPDFRGYNDTVSSVLYGTTTLVNDHSKVYKGGSWNDMAFWLNPATRRFMNEDDASSEVGFRCAMTLVGAPEIHPEGKPHYSEKKAKQFKAKSQ